MAPTSNPAHPAKLSEKRADDRKVMADQIVKLAEQFGCTLTRNDGDSCLGPRAVLMAIQAPGGLCLNIDFDGGSVQPDVHVLSWHMHHESNAKLDPDVFGGNVNPHHHRKATHVAHGFDALMDQLTTSLALCQNGSAYQPAPTAQDVLDGAEPSKVRKLTPSR